LTDKGFPAHDTAEPYRSDIMYKPDFPASVDFIES